MPSLETSPRVLILDDDAGPWPTVTAFLRQLGLGVVVTAANEGALDLIAAGRPEVVIVDLGTSASAVLALMAKVKRASPETELIVTASELPVAEAVAALRHGAFDIVMKPFQATDIGPAILRAIDRRQSAREAASILQEGRRLLSVRERENLPTLAVDFAHKAMRADVVSLMLKDTTGRLYIAHAHGLPSELLSDTRLQIGQRIAGRVAELRTAALIDDALYRDERFEDFVPFGRVRSSIVHPLMADDHVLGILNLGRADAAVPFEEADLERAALVASQISLAFDVMRQWQRTGMADRLALISQLSSSVTHEITNPLAAIAGQSDLALESLEGGLALFGHGTAVVGDEVRAALLDARQCVEHARVAAAELKGVLSDLRATMRCEPGQDGVTDLAEAVRAATRLATSDVRRHAVVERDIPAKLMVAGDSSLLCQAFLNLILNASHAMRAARTTGPEIRIASSRTAGEIRIDVIDNGPGLPPADLARAFEPFFVARTNPGRLGFGLSIAHDIIQGLGGRMDVSSSPGHGTTVSVYLPTAAAEVDAAAAETRPGASDALA